MSDKDMAARIASLEKSVKGLKTLVTGSIGIGAGVLAVSLYTNGWPPSDYKTIGVFFAADVGTVMLWHWLLSSD